MKGSITISHPTYGSGEEYVEISVKDNLSRNRFVHVKLTYSDFTKVLMGMSETSCSFEVKGLSKVGLKKESKELLVPIPNSGYGRDRENAIKEAEKACPEGWEVSLYFGSQNSFFNDEDGQRMARTTISRWVSLPRT